MGYAFGLELSDSDMPLEKQLHYHLISNHFPPVPSSMIQPCIDAIDAYWEGDTSVQIQLPKGITYKGLTTAPAYAILDQHHLSPWTSDYDYDSEE